MTYCNSITRHVKKKYFLLIFRCKCGNCDTSLLQNAYEAQCCQEIERCTETLCSDEVLQDVETPPTCVLYHPGFRINCLEKWSLKMAVTKYRTKERRRY